MEILEAYDLSGSCVERRCWLAVISETVAHWWRQRELGLVPKVERKRPAMETDFMRKVDELLRARTGRSGRTSRTGSCVSLGYSRIARGRRDGGLLRRSVGGDASTAHHAGRGRCEPGCGPSSTTVTDRRSTGARRRRLRVAGVGRDSGSWSRCGTRRLRAW